NGGLPQGLHALRLRELPNCRDRRGPEDRVLEFLADRHDLVDRHAPLHAGEAARRAALALVDRDLPAPGRDVAVGGERLLVDLIRLLAREIGRASCRARARARW